jgi:hypothetical protein
MPTCLVVELKEKKTLQIISNKEACSSKNSHIYNDSNPFFIRLFFKNVHRKGIKGMV